MSQFTNETQPNVWLTNRVTLKEDGGVVVMYGSSQYTLPAQSKTSALLRDMVLSWDLRPEPVLFDTVIAQAATGSMQATRLAESRNTVDLLRKTFAEMIAENESDGEVSFKLSDVEDTLRDLGVELPMRTVEVEVVLVKRLETTITFEIPYGDDIDDHKGGILEQVNDDYSGSYDWEIDEYESEITLSR